MFRGMLIVRNGMAFQQRRLEVIADNIANVNTSGYKSKNVASSEFAAMLQQRMGDAADDAPHAVGTLGFGAQVLATSTDTTQGSMVMTGQDLDVAIQGPGAFLIQTPGGVLTTRNGSFRQDEQGRLVTQEGYPVLVGGQPIAGPAGEVRIGTDGTVTISGQTAGRLDLEGATVETSLRVGWLESSNVSLATEMTEMVEAARLFSAGQRVLQAQDSVVGSAISIGKL